MVGHMSVPEQLIYVFTQWNSVDSFDYIFDVQLHFLLKFIDAYRNRPGIVNLH